MRIFLALVFCALSLPASAAENEDGRTCQDSGGDRICISQASYVPDVCRAIDRFAQRYELPPDFFARLIWQESRFNPGAISPAGAQGIAQFMPGTARLRDLRNPFDPSEALFRSAQYLRELELKFGNLGLAAAAYNGGEGRMGRYLAGTGGLPAETRAYVSIITGRTVEGWVGESVEDADFTLVPDVSFHEACIDMASATPMPELLLTDESEWQPWGVLIAQSFSQQQARQSFLRAQRQHSDVFADRPLLMLTVRNLSLGTRLRYSAQLGTPTRQDAQELCAALIASGGNCIVERNRE
jgi:hypothetical protein